MKRHLRSTLLILFCLVLAPASALSANITDTNSGVFAFQKKLAEGGSAQSQYKLATMYELGIGTEQDLEQAGVWYARALEKGATEAEQRLVYLDIRQKGFNNKEHGPWLKEVKTKAASGDQQSLLLLGQLYSYGIGVKKNMNKAMVQLSKVDVMQTPLVVYEIERVEAALQKQKTAKAKVPKKKPVKQASVKALPPENKNVKQVPPDKSNPDVKADKPSEEEILAEKRKRYEEVMRKLKEEEALLEAEQEWAESKSSGEEVIATQ